MIRTGPDVSGGRETAGPNPETAGIRPEFIGAIRIFQPDAGKSRHKPAAYSGAEAASSALLTPFQRKRASGCVSISIS